MAARIAPTTANLPHRLWREVASMAKALVACETSGIMRRALLALGHDV